MRRTIAFIALLWSASPTLAHGGEAHDAALWTFDPWIVMPLLGAATLYIVGAARLWHRVGVGRGIRRWQAGVYAAGWLALAGALCSPLHWLGEHLFTFHMIEHEIVMAIAAPLIAVARPLTAYLWALRKSTRVAIGRATQLPRFRAIWNWLTRPGVATLLHGVAIWIWHAPPLFDAAVTTEWMHRLQHLSFLLSALLFWWALVRTTEYGAVTFHLFVTMVHTSVLGALMALSPRVLYAAQTAEAPRWGLTSLEDQQLAGIVMWVPAGTIYAGAALAFMALWIARPRETRAAFPPFIVT